MLALAINCEFDLGFDMTRVALMLAVHELGECIVGDIPASACTMSQEEKNRLEREAVTTILKGLHNSEYINQLCIEFEERKTPMARFAHLVDKLECDLQCKFYEETGCNDLERARPQIVKEKMQPYLERGLTTVASIWISIDKKLVFEDEELFESIIDYIVGNKVFTIDEFSAKE